MWLLNNYKNEIFVIFIFKLLLVLLSFLILHFLEFGLWIVKLPDSSLFSCNCLKNFNLILKRFESIKRFFIKSS